MKLIGKMYMSVICPLCNFNYVLDRLDFQFVNQKVQDCYIDQNNLFHSSESEKRVQFYCSECNREIKTNRYAYVCYTDTTVDQLYEEMKNNF